MPLKAVVKGQAFDMPTKKEIFKRDYFTRSPD
jgi:hypothetical protein